MELNEHNRFRVLANSSSFYRSIYSEIEEVGWEHTVNLGVDLTFLSFRIRMKDKTFLENLTSALETELRKPPDVQKNDQQVECGICYAQCLSVDEELGTWSGTGTDYTCDNSNCNRAFHSVCLGDWLRSITTRQYFSLSRKCPLFGSDMCTALAVALCIS